MRSFLYAFATGAYFTLLGGAIFSIVVGNSYYLDLGFPPAIIESGIDVAVYGAVMAAVPLVVRWKLKGMKWWTLGVYTLVLGIALYMQATLQNLLNQEGAAMVLMVLAIGSAGLSAYCFYKKLQFIRAVLRGHA